MAYNMYQPDKDAGWGLIFRLNHLWDAVDRRALSGNYNHWELTLDRIYSNLLYRNPLQLVYDEDGETVLDLDLSDKDKQIWKIIKRKIKEAKRDKKLAFLKRKSSEYRKACEAHYLAVFQYDIWLRKFMQEHQLYLKEVQSNPSKAMWNN